MKKEEIREIALEVAHGMDWEDLTNHGAGSCVASHGCAGVTQDDLIEFSTLFLAAITEKEEPAAWMLRDKVSILRDSAKDTLLLLESIYPENEPYCVSRLRNVIASTDYPTG